MVLWGKLPVETVEISLVIYPSPSQHHPSRSSHSLLNYVFQFVNNLKGSWDVLVSDLPGEIWNVQLCGLPSVCFLFLCVLPCLVFHLIGERLNNASIGGCFMQWSALVSIGGFGGVCNFFHPCRDYRSILSNYCAGAWLLWNTINPPMILRFLALSDASSKPKHTLPS